MQDREILTEEERRALERFKNAIRLLLKDNLLTLRLFGSKARGEGTEEPDLDVLVVLRARDRAVCRQIVAEALEVDLTYGTNLAPTILSAEEYRQNQEYQTPFYRNLERESRSL
jgi:predicted nucleotidyltransferase